MSIDSGLVLAPSVLSADFGRLDEEVRAADAAGADWIHLDVMDGRFVPNITIGPLVVEAIGRATKKPLDVHLMIVEPERYIDEFANAGANRLLVHVEGAVHLQRTLQSIKNLGCEAGIVVNPHTHESAIEHVLGDADQILVMTVNPGFGGQSFLPSMLRKIERIRRMIDDAKLSTVLEVDGGINPETIGAAVAAGARAVVAGNAVFAGVQKLPAPPTFDQRVAMYRAAMDQLRAKARA